MLTFLDQHGSFALPTGWGEVSTKQFCAVDPLPTVEARASYFAGRPIQVNGAVADALAWMLEGPPATGGLAYPPDLGQETYLQVESVRSMLATQPLHECLPLVYACFKGRYDNWGAAEFNQARSYGYAERILDWPITETYPAVAHCLAELQRLAAKYARLAAPDTTEAGRRAQEAGSDRLQAYGYLPTARWFAQQYGLTLEQALNTSWETVAVHLLLARDEAEIADKLNKNSQNA